MTNYRERERSVGVSLLVDFVLLMPDLVAAVLSQSLTLLADVLKCANELVATLLSWLALRKIGRGKPYYFDYGLGKLENLTSIVVAALMFLSLIFVLYSAVLRLHAPHEMNKLGVMLGIGFMLIGGGANIWLWIKNRRVARQSHSPIMESQWRLFRAKAVADLTVLATLVLSVALGRYRWAIYIDPCGSLAIAGFLAFSIYHVVAHSVYDLLDRTLDESLQLVIVKDLHAFYDHYKALHGVHSRRSGSNIYVEIFLEFDGDKRMSEVQDAINRIQSGIEQHIKGSFVSVIPSTKPVRKRYDNPS